MTEQVYRAGSLMPLARVHGPGDMRIDHIAAPAPGPRDVVVQVGACGICGSDLGYVAKGGLGGPALAEPLPIGHELAGTVVALGEQVEGIALGMRCAVNPDDGLIGGGGPEGAMAPYLLVPDARVGTTLFPIPETLSFEEAALAEPLSVALHGINIAGAKPGAKVVVLGAGPIGLSTIALLRHRGVDDIVAADLSDTRLERARQMGATHLVNPGRDELIDAVGAAHGTGTRFGFPYVDTDIFIDTAGALPALEAVVEAAKYRARIVVVALYAKPLQLNLWKLMANEITLSGSIAVMRHAEFGECVDLLAARSIDVAPLISHRIGFDSIHDAFAIAADTNQSAKVMLTFVGDAPGATDDQKRAMR
jgi:2-desacetyl-2-hydroxyethyl bacteriochlorophyllide A dehydrogenase